MNAESPRLPSTEITSRDIGAIWSGALLVVYLAGTGLLFIGAQGGDAPIVLLHFGVLTAIAVATWSARVPVWLRLWAPLMTLLFLYSEIPALLRALGHTSLYDSTVMQWEHTVFGSQPAIEWASRWNSQLASEFLHAAYASFYAIIYVVPVLLFAAARMKDFEEASFALLFTYLACCILYIAFPVAGPRYLFTPGLLVPNGVIRQSVRWLLESRSSEGTAFPSSHVALAITASVLAFRYYRGRGLVIGLVTIFLSLGAVYGGFHYGVDVLGGAALGFATTAAALWVHRRLRSANVHAKASAPT
jgi:membrane-associated phospholipid phosphatase